MNWLDVFGNFNSYSKTKGPIYAHLVDIVCRAIQSSQLVDRQKLPTSRELAKLLQIDRSTVCRAYLELERKGLIKSHVGQGTYVTLALADKPQQSQEKLDSSMLWSDKFSRLSQTAFSIVGRQAPSVLPQDDVISFAGGIPTQEFFPQDEFQEIVSFLNNFEHSKKMFSYSPAEGHDGLCKEVGKHLNRQGIEVDENELLIVSGSQQGIDIVSRTFVDPGDVVLLEEPSYFWANCNFQASQARCVSVPVDQDGLQVDFLSKILARQRAKLLYVMPTFQNPTGSTLSLERRIKLLELAQTYQLPILEDNFVGDLRFAGESLPSLRQLDRKKDIVIHQGTFSKALCPGLRLGWLVAPSSVMARLRLTKRSCDLSTNSTAQVIMAEYLRRGYYEKHLAMVRALYRRRCEAMCSALKLHLGKRALWARPDGGLFIWVKLEAGASTRKLLPFAEREGVTFSSGDIFFLNGDHGEYLRLSFIQLDEKIIEEGIARLGRAVKAYLDSRLSNSGDSFAARVTESALI